MANSFFRFKQFTVFQENCAMKVGTDGVLLGAWAGVGENKYILDIGTGTGLVAMMLAQRNANAMVKAIDIDTSCISQSQQNIACSPFSHQIDVEEMLFQEFAVAQNMHYNLIVSNPPFFQNSLKSPCTSRNHARHTDSLSFYEVISLGAHLLSEDGRIALILPYEYKQPILEHAATVSLFANRITNVFPLPHKPAKRLLVEFGSTKTECIEADLTIELDRHQYTREFIALTNEFYLDK